MAGVPPSYDDSLKKGNVDSFNNPGYPPQHQQHPGAYSGYGQQPAGYGQPQQAPGGYGQPPQQPPYPNTGYNNQYAPYQNNADPASYNMKFHSPDKQGGYAAPPPPPNEPRSGLEPLSDDPESGGFTTGASFDDKNVRRVFIRKVFGILSLQLLVTFGVVCLFTFNKTTKDYIRQNSWSYYIAYGVFFVVYMVLICGESIRRKHPHNIILLSIFTLALSYMAGTISSFYDTQSVAVCLGVTVLVCFAVTLFSIQTKFDITKCAGVLFVMSLVFMLFGFITIFTYHLSWYIHIVYGCLGALLFTVFLAFDVQMVMGGRKFELGPEEHILGALHLYIDVVYIFLFLLQIFGRSD